MNWIDALPAAAVLATTCGFAWRDAHHDRRDLRSLRAAERRRRAMRLHPATATAALSDGSAADARAAIGMAEAHGSRPTSPPE